MDDTTEIKQTPNRRLAIIVHELLGHEPKKYPHEGAKAIRAVFNTIKAALLRGESVHVRGFGTFKVLTRHPQPTPHNILGSTSRGRPLAYSGNLRYHAPHLKTVFIPSITLMAMINLDTPNYKERRTQRTWNL